MDFSFVQWRKPVGASHDDARGRDATAYAEFLRDAAKDRDFKTFQPWRLAQAQNDYAWHHGVVHVAARRFQRDAAAVADDLAQVLDERRRYNETRYLSRVPSLAFRGLTALKSGVARTIVLPLVRWSHRRRIRASSQGDELASAGWSRTCGQTPRASIVIVSFNRLEYLRSTLTSLYATTARADFELIVVDNGSSDGSPALLRELAGRGAIDKLILCSSNRGSSAGYNLGFAHADRATRYLIKLDSDISILTPGWLPRFEAFFDCVPDAGVLAMTLVNQLAHQLLPSRRLAGERVTSWNFWISGGGCMTIRRPLFERLGYFSEDFDVKYMPDDVDYAVRLGVLGLQSFYLCGARAYHREDLDSHYAQVQQQKRRELPASREMMQRMRMEYVSGKRHVHVTYPRYERCLFPDGRRILELA
jgi:glycosyltransferase involved in cell wall biosynthesis